MTQTSSNRPPSKLVSIICPCFNESKTLDHFFSELMEAISPLNYQFEIICINDGSNDGTLDKLKQFKHSIKSLRIINLSRNFGKEAALSAGIDRAKGDYLIPIDVDLQDPPYLINRLLEKAEEGYDTVLAKRVDRSSDSKAKRVSAALFYKLHNKVSKNPIPENVGDFRLFTRRVAESIKTLPENQRFMKGIFAWVGYPTATVEYIREKRVSGDSKFSPWKLWNFALEGITSFSTVPLRVWTYIGMIISGMAFFYGFLIIIKTIFFSVDVPGYASLLTSILFLGGIQLMSIGVLGEYIGRIYMESKNRPPYIIEDEY